MGAFIEMKIIGVVAAFAIASGLGGCVSVFEGTSQDIVVNTAPAGAHCVLIREGQEIGALQNTPGTLTVRKSKYDITIRCDKEGYQQAALVNKSGTSAAIAANIAVDVILTLGISSIVDSANGADNKYDSPVSLTLVPMEGTPAAVAAANLTIAPTTDIASLISDKTVYAAQGSDISVYYFAKEGAVLRQQGSCKRAGKWAVTNEQDGTHRLCLDFSVSEADKARSCYAVAGKLTQPQFLDVSSTTATPIETRFMAVGNTEKLSADGASCP